MKVRVKGTMPENFFGFHLKRRYPGDEFELDDLTKKVDGKDVVIVKAEARFSEKWMERVEVKKKPGPKPREKDEALGGG